VSVKEQVRVVAELLDPEEVGRVETRESDGICKKIFQRSSFFECTGYSADLFRGKPGVRQRDQDAVQAHAK
jgi:hypothetical protein